MKLYEVIADLNEDMVITIQILGSQHTIRNEGIIDKNEWLEYVKAYAQGIHDSYVTNLELAGKLAHGNYDTASIPMIDEDIKITTKLHNILIKYPMALINKILGT